MRTKARISGLAIGLVAVVAGASCRQIAGIGDREATPACGPAFAAPACDACMEDRCCAELGASQGDLDDADVLACRAHNCEAQCELDCGGTPAVSADCSRCLARSCCEASRSCANNAACVSRRLCDARCADATCRRLCRLRDENGRDDETALLACQTSFCESECVDWSCLATPTAAQPKISITLFVRDTLSAMTPAQGVIVRRCAGSLAIDDKCRVEDEIVTSGAGIAQFSVSLASQPFDGYFELEDPQGRFLRELVFVAPRPRIDTVVFVQAFTPVARAQILQGVGITVATPANGDVVVHAVDCTEREAAGMRFTGIEGVGVPFYMRRSIPLGVDAGVVHTDSFVAFGGFLDVPPRNYRIDGRVVLDGRETTAFDTAVRVRESTVTFVDYVPDR